MANKKLTKTEIKQLAVEIREFLLEKKLWIDVRIYFNGTAFATDNGCGKNSYNDRNNLYIIEDIDPRDYFEYVNSDNILQ